MERCLDRIFQEQDLNEHGSGYFKKLTGELIAEAEKDADIYKELQAQIGSITERTDKKFDPDLRNDQFAVASTLRFLIGRQIAREIRHQ